MLHSVLLLSVCVESRKRCGRMVGEGEREKEREGEQS